VARWPQLLLSRRLCVLLSHIAGWLESAWRDERTSQQAKPWRQRDQI